MPARPGRGPRIVRVGDRPRVPWKNGGGETVEIAASPDGAGLDDFDWRVSLARVASDGPFSIFPGRDRTLAVVEGDGLELVPGTAPPVRLTAASDPFTFPADVPCLGRLSRGPVTNLNLMSERTRFRHAATRLGPARTVVPAAGETVVVVCTAGTVSTPAGTLNRHDALVVSARQAAALAPAAPGSAAMVLTILRTGWRPGAGDQREVVRTIPPCPLTCPAGPW